MTELFSKAVALGTDRQVGVVETPHGIALEGVTYYPETGNTEIKRILCTVEAGIELLKILNEWVESRKGLPF